MGDFWKIFVEVVGKVLATLAVMAVPVIVTWLNRSRKKRRKSGIRRIYPRSIKISGMTKAIENADELCVIGVAARCFMSDHRGTIENRLQKCPDFKMRLILVDPKSLFHVDYNEVVGNKSGLTISAVKSTLDDLDTINDRAGVPHKAFYEARYCQTEYRNQIVICKRRERGDGVVQAWITVSMQMERQKELFEQFPTLEMNDEKSMKCYQHFEDLWNKYDPSAQNPAAISHVAKNI